MKPIYLVVVFCLSLSTSLASTIAVDALTGLAGLGGGITEGYEFEVTESDGIVVDGLGFWDEQANGFLLGQTFQVGLWDANDGTLLGSSVVTSTSPLTASAHSGGDWRINPVTPFHLAPGLYRIGGLLPDVGANAVVSSGATIDLAPGIQLIRYLRHIDGSTLVMPDIPPPYPEATYVSTTFTFTPGPLVTNGPSNLFTFSSAPNSWIGQGQTLTFTTVTATRTFQLGVYTDSVEFNAGGYGLRIVGENLSLPQKGFYPGAARWPFMDAGVGMAFTGPGRANNRLTGWYHVLEADYKEDGQVETFAVDFVQYDETFLNRWNRGSIRFNSSIAVPGPPPPIAIDKLVRREGEMQFRLTGPPESRCVVELSSDLVAWSPIATNTVSPLGLVSVTNTTSFAEAREFYRTVSGAGGGGDSNDQFANRTQISPAGETVTGSNASATKESGESNHGADPGGKSMWWSWTAPSSGMVMVSLDGSSFDTTLGVYTGSAVNGLVSVAQDNDGGAGNCSRVIFNATTGVTYQIAVDGQSGDNGDITLTVQRGPLNDDFADRLQIIGSSDVVIGSNIGATSELSEPYHWEDTGETSVWWRWTAPGSGPVTIGTFGSNFDTLLAAYRGSSLSGLILVANNDDAGTGFTSQISFFATAGTTYQIAVDGYDYATGGIILRLQQ